MTASLLRHSSSSIIGGGRTRDVSEQQMLDGAMAGRLDETMTTMLEGERVIDDEWRKLYDGVDDNNNDDDVFVNAFNDDDREPPDKDTCGPFSMENADFLQMVKQLDGEDVLLAAESGGLDNTAWTDHDTPLFPLVESELDNYWNPFNPFEAADLEDRCRVTGTPPGRQSAVKRQLGSPSPVPLTPPTQLEEQPPVYSPETKRSRDSISPVFTECCGVIRDDSAATRPSRYSSLSDVVDDANVAMSSASSVDLPLGLLSSLPPNCSVYITHRPAPTSDQNSPPPVTQIIINHARPSSTLPPLSSTLHHRPSMMPLPPLPLSPQLPLPPITFSQFHPLDDVRLREPAPNVSVCPNKAPLTTVLRPPKSLSTYAAEFRQLGVGIGDMSTWKYEPVRRASDSAAAHPDADRCRHHSSPFLPMSKVTSPASNSLMPASTARSSASYFQRPTSLSLSSTPPVLRQQRRQPSSSAAAAGPQSLPSSWQRRSVDGAVQSRWTPTTSMCQSPQTPGDETGGSLMGGLSRSCLEDSTADSSSSGDSGSDGAACMLSNALRRFRSASSSSSPSSLVEGAEGRAELRSPLLSPATAKPRQRTIDALSKKIQRNQTQKTVKPTTVASTETQASSITRPDSSCPTPPLSRQLTLTPFSSSASHSPSDSSEISAISGYSTSSQRKLLLKNECSDVGNSSDNGDLSTNGGNRSNADKDPVLPSRRKRTGRRKNQPSRQTSANSDEKNVNDDVTRSDRDASSFSCSFDRGTQEFTFEESDVCRFSIDAPVSTLPTCDDDLITYLNKGQYYRLNMEYLPEGSDVANSLKSVVMVLFGDNVAIGDELEAWRLWHSRQPSYKQRILDVDYKNSCGVVPNSIEELAYNATAVAWSPLNQPVRVNIAVNCLSTDFSNQKGVKGIPLHIQVDTYDVDDLHCRRIHRAVCKIKVFCEKGAERKIRDEDRKKKMSESGNVTKTENNTTNKPSEEYNFRTVTNSAKTPVLFTPDNDLSPVVKSVTEKNYFARSLQSNGFGKSSGENLDVRPNSPRMPCRDDRLQLNDTKPVLLYIREQQESVFTAILLETPSVSSLICAIQQRFSGRYDEIRNVYKKSKNGILVKMDDKILLLYSNESAFVISAAPVRPSSVTSSPDDSAPVDIVLTEAKSQTPQ